MPREDVTSHDIIEDSPPVMETDVVVVDDGADLISFAETRINLLKKILDLSLRNTNEQDWVLMSARDGTPRPYLQSTGAEKIARLFGVIWTNVHATKFKNDPEDGGYTWEHRATFTIKGGRDHIECFGSRSSTDPFFKNQGQVDQRDVKMASYSNMVVNGVTRLLGIRNLSIEQLTGAGLNASRMQGIQYKEPRKPAPAAKGTAKTSEAAEGPKQPAEQSAQKKLLDLIVSVVGSDNAAIADYLEHVTEFVGQDGEVRPGVRSFMQMSDSRAMVTYGQLKKKIESGEVKVREG